MPPATSTTWPPLNYDPHESRLIAPPPEDSPEWSLEPLLKSITEAKAKGQTYRTSSTLYAMGAYDGVKDAGGAMDATYRILRRVPCRNPVVASILNHRKAQFASYCKRPMFRGDTGFEVRMRDVSKKVTPAAQKVIDEITDILEHGGIRSEHPRTGQVAVWNAEGTERAFGIRRAVKELMNDSLILDAAAIHKETGMNQKRYPIVYWKPVDAALIRFAEAKDTGKDAEKGYGQSNPYRLDIRRGEIDEAAYVMMNDMGAGVQREFAWNELSYMVRNPRTDRWRMGYGWSEIEQLIDIIAGIVYGIDFNTTFFNKNHVPPGLLALTGNWGEPQVQEFRRQCRMMVGPNEWWSMPVITAPPSSGTAASYVPLRQDPGNGMYWQQWLIFCAAVAASVYLMDSSEINFVNFGQSANALANQSPENKLKYAQETGMVTMLHDLAGFFTEEIVWQIPNGEDFLFTFKGLGDLDAEMEMAEQASRMQNALSTPNDERARMDEPPIYDPIDREMWDKIELEIRRKRPDDSSESEIAQWTAEIYKQQGGKLALWPNAPVGNAQAFQLWQQEHAEELGGGQQLGPDGQPLPPGAQGGQPGQPGQEGPPDQNGPEGEDTHVTDLGAAMLRRQDQRQQQNALVEQQKQQEREKQQMHGKAVAAAKQVPSTPNANPQDLRKSLPDRTITVRIVHE